MGLTANISHDQRRAGRTEHMGAHLYVGPILCSLQGRDDF